MASRTVNGDRARIGARTLRRDRWWLSPLVTVAVLGGFVIYEIGRASCRERV